MAGEASEGAGSSEFDSETKMRLRLFTGTWAYDPKLTKARGVQSATAEKIMKKAQVPLTKRLGLQYFVGKDVSQTISLDRSCSTFTIEAFIKGISTWKKQLHLDKSRHDVVDYLFGKATSFSYFDQNTKELFYVLDAKKSEKGRLAFVRLIENDNSTMILSIRWYPNTSDESLYISHYRIYTRKDKEKGDKGGDSIRSAPVSIPESEPETVQIPLKRETSSARYSQHDLSQRNSTDGAEHGPTPRIAVPAKSMVNIPIPKAASLPQSFIHTLKRQSTVVDSAPVLARAPIPSPKNEHPTTVSSPDLRQSPTLAPQPALWRSLVLPISAFVVSILIFLVVIRYS